MNKTKDDATPAKYTDQEAWLHLAAWWDDPHPCACARDNGYGCGRQAAGPNLVGLCSSISMLRHYGHITEAQEADMLDLLPKAKQIFAPGVRPFLWPTTPEGAKARAEFCRAQAAKAKVRG